MTTLPLDPQEYPDIFQTAHKHIEGTIGSGSDEVMFVFDKAVIVDAIWVRFETVGASASLAMVRCDDGEVLGSGESLGANLSGFVAVTKADYDLQDAASGLYENEFDAGQALGFNYTNISGVFADMTIGIRFRDRIA